MYLSTSRPSTLLLLALVAILLSSIITPIQSSPMPGYGKDHGKGYGKDHGEMFSGDATFFTPGLGACGIQNTENDKIVALVRADKYLYSKSQRV